MPTLRWLLGGLALVIAAALTTPPYQLATVDDGFVVIRLNVWTGRLALCVPDKDRVYTCTAGGHAAPDEWQVLDQEPAAD